MTDITITTGDDTVSIATPYNPEFVKDAKMIGGRWDPARRVWTFDLRDKERVEQLAAKHYGYVTTTGRTVTIRIKASDYDDGQEIIVVGRVIARRPGRDLPVRLADNAVVVAGRFSDSGGSRKTPYVSWPDDEEPVIEIRDLPAGVTDILDKPYELVDDDRDRTRALRDERVRLLKRLAEIDAILDEQPTTTK